MREGGEKGGARPDYHIDLPMPDALPLVHPLARRELTVQDGHPPREATSNALHRLWSQRNLWHHHDGLTAGGNRLRDRLQIHLGLATPGDAVEEKNIRLMGAHR